MIKEMKGIRVEIKVLNRITDERELCPDCEKHTLELESHMCDIIPLKFVCRNCGAQFNVEMTRVD